jgi:hypothetical protein
MANFRKVNAAIKRNFPELDIEAVRADGYVYFDGDDGWEIESIYIHGVSAPTETVTQHCIHAITARQN